MVRRQLVESEALLSSAKLTAKRGEEGDAAASICRLVRELARKIARERESMQQRLRAAERAAFGDFSRIRASKSAGRGRERSAAASSAAERATLEYERKTAGEELADAKASFDQTVRSMETALKEQSRDS